MKFIFFIFKYRFRRAALNNLLKKKKIKEFFLIDLTGPIKFHLVGIFLMFLDYLNLISRRFILISCDAEPLIKNNGINIWFGGTSLKVPKKFQNLKNNCYVFENFYKKEKNLINFAPTLTNKNNLNKNFKFVYISELKITNDKKIKEVWNKNKIRILKDFSIIEKKIFWKKNAFHNFNDIQKGYIEIRNFIRLEVIRNLNKILKKNLIVYGSSWKKYIADARESNYEHGFTKEIYKGNVCLDFGSKWASSTFYPRSIEIIENGGILLQLRQSDSEIMIGKFYKHITYNSVSELTNLLKKIHNINSDFFTKIINSNEKKFQKINEKTLKKIYGITKKIND